MHAGREYEEMLSIGAGYVAIQMKLSDDLNRCCTTPQPRLVLCTTQRNVQSRPVGNEHGILEEFRALLLVDKNDRT